MATTVLVSRTEHYTPKEYIAGYTPINQEESLYPATPSDYDAVVKIDTNLYWGLDYLSSTYNDLFHKPGAFPFVYKKDDRVVAFVTMNLLDGGQTLMASSGRVVPDCRGGGVYSRFNRRVLGLFRESRDLQNVTFTTSTTNMAANGHRILKTYRIVEERVITTLVMDLVDARGRALAQLCNVPGLRELSRADTHAMMSRHPSDLKHLFPQERVTVDWKPHRIMAANTDSVYGEGQQRLCLAFSPERERARQSPRCFKKEESKDKHFPGTLLTFGSYFPANLCSRYQLDVFGSESEEHVRAQLERHFLHLLKNSDEEQVVIQIFSPASLSNVLDGMTDEFCLKEFDIPAKTMTVLEAPYSHVAK